MMQCIRGLMGARCGHPVVTNGGGGGGKRQYHLFVFFVVHTTQVCTMMRVCSFFLECSGMHVRDCSCE